MNTRVLIEKIPDFIHNILVNAPDEEIAKKNYQAGLDIFGACGWIHKAAKLSVEPGIKTVDDFRRKFPGQLSDKDLPIGKHQKPTPHNYYYNRNEARSEARRELHIIHSSNDSRSDMFRDNLASYHFIDTQTNLDWRELARVQMEFSEVTEIVINSTEILRRTSNEDIRRRTINLLGAEPVMLDLEKVTVDLLNILNRKGDIYNRLAMNEDGSQNMQYINSICPSAGNTSLRYRTLMAMTEVRLEIQGKNPKIIIDLDYQSK